MAYQCKLSAAMVAESKGRSYVLEVRGYSRARAVEYMDFPPFSVGGHNFVVRYSPNGYSAGYPADVVSFSLVFDSDDARDVKVNARFSLPGEDDGQQRVSPYSVLVDRRNGSCFGCDIPRAALEGSWGMITDDCLSVRFDLTVEKDMRGEETMGDRFVVVPPSDLHLHLGSLLESMVGADVTFHVGVEMFLAHRFVLAARSSVFKAELLGAMKENAGGPVVIHEMEPDVFKCLLRFIYTDSLPAINVVMAQHLLVAADRYDVERLKLICAHKLCSNIDANMVAATLVLAEQHNCHGLKEACLQFLASPSNLDAMVASGGIDHLNSSCPSVIKEFIAGLLPVEMKAAKDIVMTM